MNASQRRQIRRTVLKMMPIGSLILTPKNREAKMHSVCNGGHKVKVKMKNHTVSTYRVRDLVAHGMSIL